MKRVFAFCIAVILIFSSCTAPQKDIPNISEEGTQKVNFTERIVAAWIYYNEIEELVKKSNSESEFTANIENAVNRLTEYAVNTVILHVRAFDDAFYQSDIFPVSKYCADSDGRLKFDVLKCFLEVCRTKNVKLWCWINPYRINKADDVSVIKKGYFQYDALNSENEQMLIHSANGVYYNPADGQVKHHIIDGIREILENYDVDGIHFDDYFYPRTDKDFDTLYYEKYKSDGGCLSLPDFRRENVNSLIASVYTLTKKYNKVFSISPISNIDQNINSYYADVKLWATSPSYVDYIIPQIYFGFENSVQPFAETLKKWVDLTGDSQKLLIGLAIYKSGTTDSYAKSGKDEWKSRDVISKEIDLICENYKNIGFVYYSASFLYKDGDEGIELEKSNIRSAIKRSFPSSVT